MSDRLISDKELEAVLIVNSVYYGVECEADELMRAQSVLDEILTRNGVHPDYDKAGNMRREAYHWKLSE